MQFHTDISNTFSNLMKIHGCDAPYTNSVFMKHLLSSPFVCKQNLSNNITVATAIDGEDIKLFILQQSEVISKQVLLFFLSFFLPSMIYFTIATCILCMCA